MPRNKSKKATKKVVCDECGMEFEIQKFDKDTETMRNGKKVTILSFICPKCDNRYVVSVMDDESLRLRHELNLARNEYATSCDKENIINSEEKEREARKKVDYKKRQLGGYMNRLRREYIKETRRRGR